MSSAKNNIVRNTAPKSIFESALNVVKAVTGCSWNQGDLLSYDGSNDMIVPLTVANSTSLLGVARNTISSGKLKSPYQGTAVDASQALEDIAGPVFGVEAEMVLKSGDSFVSGDPVYPTADPQTVSSVSAGVSVGIYVGPAVTATSTSVGAVKVGCRHGLGGGIQF